MYPPYPEAIELLRDSLVVFAMLLAIALIIFMTAVLISICCCFKLEFKEKYKLMRALITAGGGVEAEGNSCTCNYCFVDSVVGHG